MLNKIQNVQVSDTTGDAILIFCPLPNKTFTLHRKFNEYARARSY